MFQVIKNLLIDATSTLMNAALVAGVFYMLVS